VSRQIDRHTPGLRATTTGDERDRQELAHAADVHRRRATVERFSMR
jgi:hypothetical protein